MDKPVLNLSQLTDFLFNILQSTEDVKNILQAQCEEARFALVPWELETITRRELDKNSCTCIKIVSSEEHVREIASGIDKAVAQARKLREKLAINIAEEKKHSRQPTVQQIYAPGLTESGSKTQLCKSKVGKENNKNVTVVQMGNSDQKNKLGIIKYETQRLGQKKQGALTKRESYLRSNPELSNAKETLDQDDILITKNRLPRLGSKKMIETKKITDKKLVGTSPYNSLVAAFRAEEKSRRKKNFIAANKLSVKNLNTSRSTVISNPRNKLPKNSIHASQHSAIMKSSDSLDSRVPSAAEFENLFSKISLEKENGPIKSGANFIEENGCPVHDINAPKFLEEKTYARVDVTEGLDRFGVPSELVKILKVYHSYLNSESTSKSSDNRSGKMADRFLQEFDLMNRTRAKVPNREKLDDLSKEFLPVFKESWNKRIDFIELSKLKIRYANLDSTWKSLDIRGISPGKRKISNTHEIQCAQGYSTSNKTWQSNSVWNEACIPNLQEMSRVRCIRYANKNQLLELFDLIQRFQQLKYKTNLIELLIKGVLPLVRNSLEPMSEEYAAAYKMILIISNLLHMRVPVLVRTDK